MAGHSHSANIRHRKGRVDAARGKLFSKLAREIISAAREGGGDAAANLRLRYAIDRAKAASMPRDNIDRAVKRGSGELQGAELEELLYEGYAPGGVAILVETLTDNRNRTAPEVRKVFEKKGGTFAANGAVSWLFERKAVFFVAREGAPSEDDLLELVLELGADDLIATGESFEVQGQVSSFRALAQGFESRSIPVLEGRLAWIPTSTIAVDDKDQAAKVVALIDALEDLEDVQGVSANLELPDAIVRELDEA